MKTLAFLLAIGISGIGLADEKGVEPVKVYCFSADLEAGFKDIDASCYCVELGKRGEKKKSLAIVDERADAQVIIEYLGAEAFSERGEATFVSYGMAWTPSQAKLKETAIVSVGDFSKSFSSKGVNAQAVLGLVHRSEEWIRENRDTVLEKAKNK